MKTAKISLISTIDNLTETGLPSDDRETSESVAIGTLTAGPRGSMICFSEKTESGEIKTRIEMLSGRIRVSRMGAIESDMLFSEGVAHSSVYSIPPYSFDASIFTKKIRGEIREDGGRLDIFYDMEIGGAKKSVKMTLSYEI